jgi:DNA topoisomerase-1
MAKTLVIVESPAKAKTIGKYLGSKYMVKSSVGHVRDLPTSGGTKKVKEEKPAAKKKKTKAKTKKKLSPKEKERANLVKLFQRMAIDPENGWSAHYEILPGKEKVVNDLKKHAEKAESILLATDLDREGEAIAWHLREAIGGDPSRYKRVVFGEITKNAIQKAFEKPGELNLDLVHAQQTRRFLDRIVGFMISPILWAKVARGLSAGRVQSVAVRLVYEREKEIKAFIPDEYWEINANTKKKSGDKREIGFQLTKENGKPFKAVNEEQAGKAAAVVRDGEFAVSQVEKKPTSTRPSAPFITSTLQQGASVRLGFGVKKTMVLAQRLYEQGFITYMRTDSTNLSKDAVEQVRGFIGTEYGKNYMPTEPKVYAAKKNAQEAHEAIRPSDVTVIPEKLPSTIDKDGIRLYDMIWRQFVACQMVPANYDTTNLFVEKGPYTLKARGRVLKFDGYTRVQPTVKRKGDEDQSLPEVKEGEVLNLGEVKPTQHFTKPPPRFTEASLVKEMEKKGIGRPSTYAAIISTIQSRGYVKVDKRRFYCLKMGEIVTERLVESFKNLMEYGFTAGMEEDLDLVAKGGANWQKLLDNFYERFLDQVNFAKENMRGNDPTLTDIKCPECDREMGIRTGRTGVFLGCSGYALPPKERCKSTMNLVPGEESEAVQGEGLDDDEGNVAEIQSLRRCDACNKAMNHYLIDEERKLHVCSDNPDCEGFFVEKGKFKLKGYDGPLVECDKCGNDMHLNTGRFGKYFGCSTYPECKNTRKLLRNGEVAPPRAEPIHMTELKCEKSDGYFVLRDGAAGIFLASSEFPKSRETKKPLVEDLIRHKDLIDPKYKHLLFAPVKDPDGNPAIIRFSRKAKVHYINSESDGKSTKWVLVYHKKRWVPKNGVPGALEAVDNPVDKAEVAKGEEKVS